MKTGVLLVNTSKRRPAEMLLADQSLDVQVLTEEWYAQLYPEGTAVRTVCSLGDLAAVRSAALECLDHHPIDYVVAPTERSLQPAGYLRSFLGLPGMKYDVANLFSNKHAMKTALEAAGVPIAPWRALTSLDALESEAGALGWPVILKPAVGTGGKHTYALRSVEDAAALVADPQRAAGLRGQDCRLLVERFVEMRAEYHVDGIVWRGEVRFVATSRYFVPLLDNMEAFTGSYVLPQTDALARRAAELHADVVAALGLAEGVTHLELFETADGFLVSEITCRPGGGAIAPAIGMQCGVDLWQAFIDCSIGRQPRWERQATPHGAQIVVNTDLPIRPGRVERISSQKDLEQVPGIVRVDLWVKVGDDISSRLHTSSSTGHVFFVVDHATEVAAVIDDLSETYVLETSRPLDHVDAGQE